MAPIRILLADDHTVMRRGLRLLLEQQADFQVVGEAEDGRQAVDLAASLHPGVAVLDIGMPLLNGIEATRQIITADPAVVVVVLSMHSDETYVLRALKAGAKGYLLKNSAEADLIQAVRADVYKRQQWHWTAMNQIASASSPLITGWRLRCRPGSGSKSAQALRPFSPGTVG